MERWTVCSRRSKWTEGIQAPVVLMLMVLVSSMNSAPEASEALRKTGTWMGMRGERRDPEESKGSTSLESLMRKATVIVPWN